MFSQSKLSLIVTDSILDSVVVVAILLTCVNLIQSQLSRRPCCAPSTILLQFIRGCAPHSPMVSVALACWFRLINVSNCFGSKIFFRIVVLLRCIFDSDCQMHLHWLFAHCLRATCRLKEVVSLFSDVNIGRFVARNYRLAFGVSIGIFSLLTL